MRIQSLSLAESKRRIVGSRIDRLVILRIAIVIVIGLTVFNSGASNATFDFGELSPPQEQAQAPAGLDYSKFHHHSRFHSRMPCLLCHRRNSNSPRPMMPGGQDHLPCAGCHAQQFASGDNPICTICHTDVKSGALKSFPRLMSFNLKFDHARHLRMDGVECSTCHALIGSGRAQWIPRHFNAHIVCYRCHSPRAESGGRDISSCGTCHRLGRYSRTPEFMQAFRVGFSHAKHEKLTCSECHQVRADMPQRRQVTTPEPLNHHATGRAESCMTCHNGKRAFGGDDFSVCTRCHTGKTWHF